MSVNLVRRSDGTWVVTNVETLDFGGFCSVLDQVCNIPGCPATVSLDGVRFDTAMSFSDGYRRAIYEQLQAREARRFYATRR